MVEQSYKPKVNPEVLTQSVDILEIEQRLEEFWQAEVDKLQKQVSKERQRYAELDSRVTNLIASLGVTTQPTSPFGQSVVLQDDEQLPEIITAIRREIDKAADFQKLMDYINDNEILRTQWNRIMVGIRMSGGDEK